MLNFSLVSRLRISLILVITTALLNGGNWHFLGIYFILAIFWSFLLKISPKILLKLLGIELVFLSLMTLPNGREYALFLLVRSTICLLIMNSFLLTIPKHHLSIALKGLPLPSKMQEILILTAEYLEIVLGEIKQMQISAKLRSLNGNPPWLRYISSAMIGSLYLRSLARSQRVYNGMIMRGYHGVYPIQIQENSRENLILLLITIVTMILTIYSYKI